MKTKYTKNRWIVLVIFFTSQVVMSMGAYLWGPIAPYLKEAFSLSPVQIGTISSSLYLAAILFSIPSGISVDRFGIQKNLIFCLGLMGGSLIFLSLVGKSFFHLILFASISGIGYGMIYPISSKALLAWFDRGLRATAFGIRQSGVTIGAAITSVLTVYITQRTNYQTTFFVMGCLNLFMATIASILFLEQSSEITKAHTNVLSMMELRSLVNNKNLVLLSLIMALFCFSQSSIIAFFILYSKEYLMYPIEIAAFLLTLMMITGSLTRILWGIVSDRVFKAQRRPVLLLICGIAIISTSSIFLLTPHPPFILTSFIIICIGSSFFGSQGLTIAYVAEISEPNLVGTSTSLVISIAWLGMVLGPVSFGSVVLHFGYSVAWLLLSFYSMLSLIMSIFLK